jgi:hypothetical protein
LGGLKKEKALFTALILRQYLSDGFQKKDHYRKYAKIYLKVTKKVCDLKITQFPYELRKRRQD